MVGVPGKSRGCNTCRRRKKGCDFERPVCGQCQRLGLQCGGYARDTIWVNMTTEIAPVRRRMPQESAADITLNETLTRSAYHEKYLGIFWSSYLPNGRALPPEASQYVGGVWMNELHRLFRMENQLALKKVLLAIAVSNIGHQDDKPWMVETGISLYGSALATLASQLPSQNGEIKENSFITSKLLSLYEILFGRSQQDRISQVKNWSLHLQGELGFIAARGPEFYSTGFAHQLFVDGRMTQISHSLRSRSETILNEPEWKTTPWKETPKTAKDLLADMFAEIPGMLGELDAMRFTLGAHLKEILKHKLVSKCQRLEKDWLRWAEESAPRKSPIVPNTTQEAPVLDHLISAHIIASYYCVGIFLYSILDLATDQPLPMRRAEKSIPRTLCRKIVDIIPTFLNPSTGSFGIHGAIFPSIIVISYLNELIVDEILPAEIEILYKLFAQSKKGQTIQYFVDNMLEQSRRGGAVKMFT